MGFAIGQLDGLPLRASDKSTRPMSCTDDLTFRTAQAPVAYAIVDPHFADRLAWPIETLDAARAVVARLKLDHWEIWRGRRVALRGGVELFVPERQVDAWDDPEPPAGGIALPRMQEAA